jgi:tetratricopeptide (TPR) repeat protein
MELFVDDAKVAMLESQLQSGHHMQEPTHLLALAWCLRQRDTPRALQLLDRLELQLANGAKGDPEVASALARAQLIEAEARWLAGDLADAYELISEARASFDALQDHIGIGDARWLEASIWQERGDQKRCMACLTAAAANFVAAGDEHRADAAVARRQWYSAFNDPHGTRVDLAEKFGRGSHQSGTVATWLEGARAIIADLAGDFGEAARYFLRSYQAAIHSGQYRAAVTMASNVGDQCAKSHALTSALEWDQRALNLARKAAWPIAIGTSLMQTGNALRLLGRHDDAHATLCEAIEVLAPASNSRPYAITLGYLGELALDVGDYPAALSWFRQDEDCVGVLGQADMLIGAWHGQARALSGLLRPTEALLKAESALALAIKEHNIEGQVSTYRVFADLHRRHNIPPPANATTENAALHFLRLALDASASIADYPISDGLLDDLAQEYAAIGDYMHAYELAIQANTARNHRYGKEAYQRAIMLQIQMEPAID